VRILVTGGAGFIGSNLALRLSKLGHETVVQDDFSSATWKNLTEFKGDVLTCDLFPSGGAGFELVARQKPFDVIFHQASITDTTVMDQRQMMQNNVEAFRKLLDQAIEWGSRVVWASSCSIYGQGPVPMKESQKPDPLNVYAFSKMVMENLKIALADGGATLKDVTKVTIYICNPHDVPKARSILFDYFGEHPPGSTLCILRGLANPNFLLEIEAIAAV